MKHIFATIIIFTITAFTANASFADDNILNSIYVFANNSEYNITLNTQNSINIKENIKSSNKIVLTAQNLRISDDFTIKYEGDSKINGIIAEQSGNGLVININGQNLKNANIINYSQVNKKTSFISEMLTFITKIYNKTTASAIFAITLLIAIGYLIRKRRDSIDYKEILNAGDREYGFMKNVIESFSSTASLSQMRDIHLQKEKLNTLKAINGLEKQFNQDLNPISDDKIVYKTPARSRLGGMTNVCSKIMSPHIDKLERARVINTVKTAKL